MGITPEPKTLNLQ